MRPEIEEIFVKYHKSATKDGSMTPNDFLNFIHSVQKEERVTLEDVKKIIAEVETKMPPDVKEPTLFVTGFSNYISSAKYNSLFKPEKTQVYQDMNHPWTHYWIASSHNT